MSPGLAGCPHCDSALKLAWQSAGKVEPGRSWSAVAIEAGILSQAVVLNCARILVRVFVDGSCVLVHAGSRRGHGQSIVR